MNIWAVPMVFHFVRSIFDFLHPLFNFMELTLLQFIQFSFFLFNCNIASIEFLKSVIASLLFQFYWTVSCLWINKNFFLCTLYKNTHLPISIESLRSTHQSHFIGEQLVGAKLYIPFLDLSFWQIWICLTTNLGDFGSLMVWTRSRRATFSQTASHCWWTLSTEFSPELY